MCGIEQTFQNASIWEPLYLLKIDPEPFESELFRSMPLRRLKHLHHFGAGSLISSMNHSRYEHTIGVWVLAKHFFPQWTELHAAAIVHDIGHLPFSHAIERTLGLDHHEYTKRAIRSDPIAPILQKHGFSVQRIIDLLSQSSPLTHDSEYIGLDHLDSFLRDTNAAGKSSLSAAELVRRIKFRDRCVETDEETAMHLLNAVVDDNLIFLSPIFLAVDVLLSKAVSLHLQTDHKLLESIASMTDYQLTVELENSSSTAVRELMKVLLWEPHRIVPCEADVPEVVRADIRKVYGRQPLVEGTAVRNQNSAFRARLEELDALKGSYYFRVIQA